MGGSGCGKSTLLNCLIGELQPNAGRITYKTREAAQPVEITRLAETSLDPIRRRFGILFQSGALLNSLTVEQNVALPLREHTELDESIIEIVCTLKLEQVRMLSHRDKMPAQLSGGQKKRAALARAPGPRPGDPLLRRAQGRPRPGHQRHHRRTHHRPDAQAQRHQRRRHARDGLGLPHRRPHGHARQGPRPADRPAERLRPHPRHHPRRPADPDHRLIHQFLRGDAQGPLTDSRASASLRNGSDKDKLKRRKNAKTQKRKTEQGEQGKNNKKSTTSSKKHHGGLHA